MGIFPGLGQVFGLDCTHDRSYLCYRDPKPNVVCFLHPAELFASPSMLFCSGFSFHRQGLTLISRQKKNKKKLFGHTLVKNSRTGGFFNHPFWPVVVLWDRGIPLPWGEQKSRHPTSKINMLKSRNSFHEIFTVGHSHLLIHKKFLLDTLHNHESAKQLLWAARLTPKSGSH